jgi:hypothetical protein
MYNNACTVVHIIVIALQTAFPCPLPAAGLYAAFISEFRTSMMYRPRLQRDKSSSPDNGRYTCIIRFRLSNGFLALSLARAPARGNRLGANTILTFAHIIMPILCTYVNNVIYCNVIYYTCT